jgi:TonB family protein
MPTIITTLGLTCAVILAPLTLQAQETAGFKIIVHPSNPTTVLSQDEASDLFLKRTTNWPHGATAEPVDLAPTAPVRRVFTEQVHGRPLSAIQSFWQQRIFSGQGVPPTQVGSESEVVAFVRAHEGGVGYVSPDTPLGGVKAVSVRVPPQRVQQVPPRYPPLAQRARVEGDVLLEVVVGPTGDVIDVTVIRGLSHGLGEAAAEAVWKWKYRPATVDGQPVESTINVTVSFKLS